MVTNDSTACHICSKKFKRSYNLKRHLFIHEVNSNRTNDTSEPNQNLFQLNECPNCGKKIVDKSNYLKHLRICNEKNFINDLIIKNKVNLVSKLENISKKFEAQCQLCGKLFNKKFNFQRHLRTHILQNLNQNEKTDVNNSLFYECQKCFRKFNELKQLKNHQSKWHDLNDLNCEYCPNTSIKFTEKLDFLKHLNKMHSVKFKFQCNICFRCFRYLSQYVLHKKTHCIQKTEINNLNKCEYCGRYFTKMYNLKRHIKSKHKNCE
jgi:hypothetical protein